MTYTHDAEREAQAQDNDDAMREELAHGGTYMSKTTRHYEWENGARVDHRVHITRGVVSAVLENHYESIPTVVTLKFTHNYFGDIVETYVSFHDMTIARLIGILAESLES